MLNVELIKHIENRVGITIESIRYKSPHELRNYLTKKLKKPFKCVNKPLYKIIERGDIDKEIDKILSEQQNDHS